MSQMIILHKRSQTPGVVPSLSSLQEGELGMNTADSKLFIKSSFGEVRSFISAEQQPYTLLPDLSSIQPQQGSNQVTGLFSAVVGGWGNVVGGSGSVNINGENNIVDGDFALVGGTNNVLTSAADNGAILGGDGNLLSHPNSFILGSSLSSQAPNYTYVENLETKGTIRCRNIEFLNATIPETPNDPGVPGEIRWDENHFYLCVAVNTWKRITHDNGYNW